jgi:hypothetical protein
MHLPYTDNYPEVVAVAAGCVAASLGAVLWGRPLPRRTSNVLFFAGVAVTALFGFEPGLGKLVDRASLPSPLLWSQLGATLTTLALVWSKPRSLGLFAAAGQCALFLLGTWVKASEHELMLAHLAWYGTLLGAHGLRGTPGYHSAERPARLSYPVQDTVIFLVTVALAAFVTTTVFEFVVYNGDEVANTFQANVYGHLRAYAPVPPCPSAFENYWVFRYQGRAFSQYTPGWPLFMAPFDRLHLIWLAGPVMGGLVAVAIARLARRLALALGGSYEESERIVAVAGPLAAFCSMLGPSLLLNAGSRFSHTMVAGCFAWAVEGAAEIVTPRLSRRRALFFGVLLGSATALGLATRPSDGGFLGVGVFLYFAQALLRRKVSLFAFLGTCIGFACCGGLTLVILRLQVGTWFATGYSVTPLFHPEGKLILSFPTPYELKFGIPLATGSYCWWPVAPALAAVGLVRALGGRMRGVSFMLAVSSLCLVGFYSFVQFGRGADDGLGPRYVMPIVVAIGAGTGAALAPIVARLVGAVRSLDVTRLRRVRDYGPALLVFASAVYGVVRIAPRTYPVAYAEHHLATGPLRTAREKQLKRAIVLIYPEDAVQGWWNINQNAPMDPKPAVLFLARRSAADEVCAREHFPHRKWYRAHVDGSLTPISADQR